MFNLDAIAYIPLFCTAIVSIVLFAFLIIVKRRKTAKVSTILLLSIFILFLACIYTALNPGITYFVLMLLVAGVVLIPYVVMLAFGKPKEEVKRQVLTEEQPLKKVETIIEEVKPDEINLIEQGKEFIAIASEGFGKKEGLQNLLNEINKACINVSSADGGALLMVDDFDDVIAVKSFIGDFPPPYELASDMPHKPLRVSTSFKFAQFPLRDNIFGEVASSGKPELINNPKEDERIFENGPEDFLKLGSFIFVPIRLKDKGSVIGLIALSKQPNKDGFTQKEYDWVQTLIGFAESALKTTINFQEFKEKQELTKESDIATSMQKLLLPKKLPIIKGISLGAISENTEGVCSDVYDIIQARSDRLSFILMDVAGKGTNSFLVMSMIRAMIRLVVNTTQSAGTILSWTNRGICGEINFEHFASAALINFNPATKKVQLSTAGTTPVYLYSVAKDTVERKSITCDPIGVEKTASYKDIEFTASQGDIIITFTDGMVEALNADGKQYSVERLTSIIKTNNKLSGKEISDLIKKDIKKFIGNEALHDDQTLLVVKIQ